MTLFNASYFPKALSVTGQSKPDKKLMTLTFIQKEVEQALEEKTFSSTAEPPVAVKQAERYSAAKTPGKNARKLN